LRFFHLCSQRLCVLCSLVFCVVSILDLDHRIKKISFHFIFSVTFLHYHFFFSFPFVFLLCFLSFILFLPPRLAMPCATSSYCLITLFCYLDLLPPCTTSLLLSSLFCCYLVCYHIIVSSLFCYLASLPRASLCYRCLLPRCLASLPGCVKVPSTPPFVVSLPCYPVPYCLVALLPHCFVPLLLHCFYWLVLPSSLLFCKEELGA
jgi:hypothetical protein